MNDNALPLIANLIERTKTKNCLGITIQTHLLI